MIGVLGSALRTVVVPRAEPTLLTQTVFVGVRKALRRARAQEVAVGGRRPAHGPVRAGLPDRSSRASGWPACSSGSRRCSGPSGASSRARRSPGPARRCSPSASPSPATSRDGAVLRRRHDRAGPGGTAHLLPAVDLRPVLAPRGARRAARHPGRHPARGRGAAAPGPRHRLARPARRPVDRLGAVVRRDRGEPHVQHRAAVLPEPAPRALVDHGRGVRAGRRRAVGRRPSTCPRNYKAELCVRSGFLSLRRIAEVFDIEFDPDPVARRPDLRHPRGVRRGVRRPRRSKDSRSTPIATRRGATSPGGG